MGLLSDEISLICHIPPKSPSLLSANMFMQLACLFLYRSSNRPQQDRTSGKGNWGKGENWKVWFQTFAKGIEKIRNVVQARSVRACVYTNYCALLTLVRSIPEDPTVQSAMRRWYPARENRHKQHPDHFPQNHTAVKESTSSSQKAVQENLRRSHEPIIRCEEKNKTATKPNPSRFTIEEIEFSTQRKGSPS